MGTIEKAACGKCQHHFCYECLLSAASSARTEGKAGTCPICRQPLDFISKDSQYDTMVAVITRSLEQASTEAAEDAPEEEEQFGEGRPQPVHTIDIDFSVGHKSAGVCVQTCSGPGVRRGEVCGR